MNPSQLAPPPSKKKPPNAPLPPIQRRPESRTSDADTHRTDQSAEPEPNGGPSATERKAHPNESDSSSGTNQSNPTKYQHQQRQQKTHEPVSNSAAQRSISAKGTRPKQTNLADSKAEATSFAPRALSASRMHQKPRDAAVSNQTESSQRSSFAESKEHPTKTRSLTQLQIATRADVDPSQSKEKTRLKPNLRVDVNPRPETRVASVRRLPRSASLPSGSSPHHTHAPTITNETHTSVDHSLGHMNSFVESQNKEAQRNRSMNHSNITNSCDVSISSQANESTFTLDKSDESIISSESKQVNAKIKPKEQRGSTGKQENGKDGMALAQRQTRKTEGNTPKASTPKIYSSIGSGVQIPDYNPYVKYTPQTHSPSCFVMHHRQSPTVRTPKQQNLVPSPSYKPVIGQSGKIRRKPSEGGELVRVIIREEFSQKAESRIFTSNHNALESAHNIAPKGSNHIPPRSGDDKCESVSEDEANDFHLSKSTEGRRHPHSLSKKEEESNPQHISQGIAKAGDLPTIFDPSCTDLTCISSETVASIIRGNHSSAFTEFIFVDCRYPYEYEGGHVKGAINIPQMDMIQKIFFPSSASFPSETCIIFYCEFSSHRGPKSFRQLRSLDRKLNESRYPQLSYPSVYLMTGGYSKFYVSFKDCCDPADYVEMSDPRFHNELKKYTAKRRTTNEKRSRTFSELKERDFPASPI